MESLVGRTLGKYELTAMIGGGGMATVYKARHPGLDQHVAVKILHPFLSTDPSFVDRFRREARAVAALRHPNIVRVLDSDNEEHMYYMVMEYIGGPTLSSVLSKRSGGGGLSLPEIRRIFPPLCSAIDYAATRGMVHRDIKPANIIMSDEGEPILTDYGIAKMVGSTSLTSPGTVVGSAHYMSPEQAQGQDCDVRSDLYSLGIVLFECLAGVVPFDGDTTVTVLVKHISAPIPSIRALRPNLPLALEPMLSRALAKQPRDRYEMGAIFAEELLLALTPSKATAVTELVTPAAPAAVAPAAAVVEPSAMAPAAAAVAAPAMAAPTMASAPAPSETAAPLPTAVPPAAPPPPTLEEFAAALKTPTAAAPPPVTAAPPPVAAPAPPPVTEPPGAAATRLEPVASVEPGQSPLDKPGPSAAAAAQARSMPTSREMAPLGQYAAGAIPGAVPGAFETRSVAYPEAPGVVGRREGGPPTHRKRTALIAAAAAVIVIAAVGAGVPLALRGGAANPRDIITTTTSTPSLSTTTSLSGTSTTVGPSTTARPTTTVGPTTTIKPTTTVAPTTTTAKPTTTVKPTTTTRRPTTTRPTSPPGTIGPGTTGTPGTIGPY